ncbi:uncharacterized protein LOC118492219 [Helianthus annuus]|uniref:uncharacterized protein LOC118492219 n=1 Tax=Helianthus annuus TaxID=4232 RepID=UPI001652FF09|nr:uncharacterized protein LOC118492219 [Helianthus annuus]
MEVNSVKRMRVVGLSYGGFVAYSLAAQFKEMVERVVICCAGVCLEEKDLEDGFVSGEEFGGDGGDMLPQTPEKMKNDAVYVCQAAREDSELYTCRLHTDFLPKLVHHFNVYVPDLVFFGDSFTTRSDRSDSFQAQCVYRVMEVNSVKRMRVVGLSYGGFVAYSLAAQFKEMVERVVICCAGVCLEEKDLEDGLFPVKSLEEAAEILLPQTPEKMKELMRFTFVKPPVKTPNCILVDFIQVILVI